MMTEMQTAIIELVRSGGTAATYVAILYVVADFLKPIAVLGISGYTLHKMVSAILAKAKA